MSVSLYYIWTKLYRNPNRMIHINAMVVWMLYGFIGAVYWFLEDESGIEIVGLRWGNLAFWVLTAAVTIVVLVYLLVQTGPGNANFAWLQHFAFHLTPAGRAGVVLAKGALTSKSSGEGEIRKAMIADGNLIDCIVNLPAKLFLNTQIPAALWFLNRARSLPLPAGERGAGGEGVYPRKGEILFIDARNLLIRHDED